MALQKEKELVIMSTAQVTIKGGKIVNFVDRYPEPGISEDGVSYSGNGWKIIISDSKIICHSERKYSSGPAICHKEFPLKDGLLGLAGGNVHNRYAYFRTQNFQDFLNTYGLTTVKKENPNQKFSGFNNYSGHGSGAISVVTDGKKIESFEPNKKFEETKFLPGNNPNLWSGETTIEVSGATWAIVATKVDYENSHSSSTILYTQESIEKVGKSIEAHNQRIEMIKKINSTEPFGSMLECRMALEGILGHTFPLTSAEMPGTIEDKGFGWCDKQYNGIGFYLRSPIKDDYNLSFSNWDELRKAIPGMYSYGESRLVFQIGYYDGKGVISIGYHNKVGEYDL